MKFYTILYFRYLPNVFFFFLTKGRYNNEKFHNNWYTWKNRHFHDQSLWTVFLGIFISYISIKNLFQHTLVHNSFSIYYIKLSCISFFLLGLWNKNIICSSLKLCFIYMRHYLYLTIISLIDKFWISWFVSSFLIL